MRGKRLFTAMLVFSLLTFTITPDYVFALTEEEQAEQDEKLVRMLIGGVAFVAFIGALFMIKKMTDTSTFQKSKIFDQLPYNIKF